jgi:hypothetical protein
MHNRFDQLGKQIGRQALGTSGPTVVHDEILPDAHHADLRHEPDPGRHAVRARLGLLGRIASVLCLIEIFGHAPSADELRACLAKHIAFWRDRARKARALDKKRRERKEPIEAFAAPFLWILAAGLPAAVRSELEPKPASGWPPGVYFFGGDVLRVGIVVASELPRERDTLLVRLMVAGPLLRHAILDLAVLPPDAHERAVAEQILLSLRQALTKLAARTAEEEDFVVIMHKTWEDARSEARTETRASDVLTVLRARGVAVPDAARERILTQKDAERLERWLERAAVAASVGDVIDEPS